MRNEELEEIMVTNYSKVFKAILLSEFKADPELKKDYYSSAIKEQREIDSAIDSKSLRLSKSLVGKLKRKGFLTKSPSEDELRKIIQEVLKESGTKNE